MVQINVSPKRNVEIIRQKNLEDNQRFLQNLLVNNARNDFLHSARSILRKNGTSQIKKKQEKIDRTTRYGDKVKSGEIGPFIPEWQRQMEEKKKEAGKRLLEKEQRKLEMERKKQEYEIRRQEKLLETELKLVERQIIMEEREKIRLAKIRPRQSSKWTRLYENKANIYERSFKPRMTKIDERIRQNLL